MKQPVSLQFIHQKEVFWKIFVGEGILDELEKLARLSRYTQVVVITDEEVAKIYQQRLNQALGKLKKFIILTIPTGEQAKNLAEVEKIYKKLLSLSFDRFGAIVAFGGGVVGDLAGFVAATFLRGVDLIQVPTTLLAQVDAAIGGKNGVNFFGLKNIIGTFYQPKVIISDVSLLSTLPLRQLRSGLAEVVKYGLIADPKIISLLERKGITKLTAADFVAIVLRCSKLKSEIVLADEEDRTGTRAILNFGHTLGHALEAEGKGTLTHGEAVGLGIIFAAEISKRLGWLKQGDFSKIVELIDQLGLPTKVQLDRGKILAKIGFDKKRQGEKIRLMLLREIGRAQLTEVEIELIQQSLSCVLK